MDILTLLTIINAILGPAIAVMAFLLKRLFAKLDFLSARLEHNISRSEVRTLIDDKMQPVQVMLKVIDKRLDLIEKEQHLIFLQVKKNGRD